MEYFSVKKMVKSADNSGSPIAPFLTKCYDMVDDECTDAIISWSATSDSFVIWDMTDFSRDLLPRYFKHSNFSSFMRQLNIYVSFSILLFTVVLIMIYNCLVNMSA